MRRLWKALSIALFATLILCSVTGFSMFWWPDIPSSPQPEQGRIYPLNNHGHYTYMNRQEHLVQELTWVSSPILMLGFVAIQYVFDPFGQIRRARKYGSVPRALR
jgi:hypothetical protein